MANGLIFYNSSLEQSILSMLSAWYKYEKVLGYSVTTKDTYGVSAADLLTYVETTATQDSYTRIALCSLTEATGTTAGKIKKDTIAAMRQMLVTASKGTTIISGTAASNAVATEVVFAAGASTEDDTYNNKYLEITATATPLIRRGRNITDYVGSTLTATILTTTAVTTSSTYVVFTHTHVDVIGDADSTKLASKVAWETLFPSTRTPMLLTLMGGSGTGFQTCRNLVKNASAITSKTVTTDTGVFTLNEFTDGDFYIAAETATTGAGQIAKITSNTANAITHASWDYLPTGTLGYSIWQGKQFVLYNKYLPLAIKTYLYDSAVTANLALYASLVDRYGDLIANASAVNTFQDLAALDELALKGRHIFEAQAKGIVT